MFDLGANVGFYSLLASELVGPNGRVFSFAPVPRNLEFLKKHLNLNNVTNCSVWDVAVGRIDDMASFQAGPNSSMGRLATEPADTFSVRVVTFDGLLASNNVAAPALIKCDIEGGEYDALQGAVNLLAEHGPIIFLATHGPEVHDKYCTFLLDLGYQLTSLDGRPVAQSDELMAIRTNR